MVTNFGNMEFMISYCPGNSSIVNISLLGKAYVVARNFQSFRHQKLWVFVIVQRCSDLLINYVDLLTNHADQLANQNP